MAGKPKYLKEKPADKSEAIENLICVAAKLAYTTNQLEWDMKKTLVDTELIFSLRVILNDIKGFAGVK